MTDQALKSAKEKNGATIASSSQAAEGGKTSSMQARKQDIEGLMRDLQILRKEAKTFDLHGTG